MIINSTVTVSTRNQLPHGTVRRAPSPSFAHAILLDQAGREQQWQIIDLYGPMEVETDADVAGWPIVYVPASDEVWQQIVAPHPIEGMPQRIYPLPEFVIPCKNCEHNKWLHDSQTGKCVTHPPAGGVCECAGFVEDRREATDEQ